MNTDEHTIIVPIPEGKEQEYEEYLDTIKKNYREGRTPPTWASELNMCDYEK